MTKISAVMALYNTPFEYLKPTIKSILSQTFSDFELIVVDDASTIEYKDFFINLKDERIKYIKLEKNSGPGHARNIGIKMATGEYIAIVDSDDVSMPQRFEIQSIFLNENIDTGLIGSAFKASNRKKPAFVPLGNKNIKTFILFNSPLNNSTVMFRREEFLSKNLFYSEDTNFAEDYELWINCMFAGVKIENLEDVLIVYTRRFGQLSREKKENQIYILKKLYKKIFDKMGFNLSEEELNLHYELSMENFNKIESYEKISNWFDKIIKYNKTLGVFDEESLVNKKNERLKSYKKIKNRLFKIKVGNYNFCLSKILIPYIEARN